MIILLIMNSISGLRLRTFVLAFIAHLKFLTDRTKGTSAQHIFHLVFMLGQARIMI